MRKILLLASICIFMSATALAGGGKDTQNRRGTLEVLDSELCRHARASAVVHENGARFTVMANRCTPGDVMTVWAFAGEDGILLNCGGGIVLPNGKFKTICDVPRGDIAPCLDCAQVLGDGVIGDPRNTDFVIEMLTHDDLEPDIAMSQIRTLNTCGFFGGTDSCAQVAVISLPAHSFRAPHHHH